MFGISNKLKENGRDVKQRPEKLFKNNRRVHVNNASTATMSLKEYFDAIDPVIMECWIDKTLGENVRKFYSKSGFNGKKMTYEQICDCIHRTNVMIERIMWTSWAFHDRAKEECGGEIVLVKAKDEPHNPFFCAETIKRILEESADAVHPQINIPADKEQALEMLVRSFNSLIPAKVASYSLMQMAIIESAEIMTGFAA